jgi:hypothetical protein
MRHQPTAPEVKIMSIDVRPEYLDSDNDTWFFSGQVPQFNTGTSTFAALLSHAGYIEQDVDPAGFLPAGEVLRGVEDALENAILNEFMAFRMRQLREVAVWAVEHGRRIEWC